MNTKKAEQDVARYLHDPTLLQAAVKKVRGRDIARYELPLDDLCQDVALELLESQTEYDASKGKVGTWIRKVINRVYQRYDRAHHKQLRHDPL